MGILTSRLFQIILFASVAWGIVLAGLSQMLPLSRMWFVIGHYVLDVAVFGVVFFFFFRMRPTATPFETTAVAMGTLVVLEYIFWTFFYNGNASVYLTFSDWILPAFLIASVIYAMGWLHQT